MAGAAFQTEGGESVELQMSEIGSDPRKELPLPYRTLHCIKWRQKAGRRPAEADKRFDEWREGIVGDTRAVKGDTSGYALRSTEARSHELV